MKFDNSTYGWTCYSPVPFKKRFADLQKKFVVLRRQLNFDAIAFTGSSGCASGFILASRNEIPIIYIRKSGEKTHGSSIECNAGHVDIKSYLIVDDFIESGKTVKRIATRINNECKRQFTNSPICVGVLLFTYGSGTIRINKTDVPIFSF
jgi:orotate phosphoribosyltransferase-like protein